MFKILDSGYCHYRISVNRWAQWPSNREATIDDCFGWYPEQIVQHANTAHIAFKEAEMHDKNCGN